MHIVNINMKNKTNSKAIEITKGIYFSYVILKKQKQNYLH